jgi:hypothetical protein
MDLMQRAGNENTQKRFFSKKKKRKRRLPKKNKGTRD